MEENPILMTAAEVCAALHLGKSKLWELVGENHLPVVRIGRATRFPRHAVLAYVANLLEDQHQPGEVAR